LWTGASSALISKRPGQKSTPADEALGRSQGGLSTKTRFEKRGSCYAAIVTIAMVFFWLK